MKIVRPEKSSHWYYKNGKPCYEVENKSKPGYTRPTTLKDARKYGLLPSVTSILSMVSKPALEAWKIEQAIISTLTLPRIKDESEELYLKRIVEDYRSIAKNAAELGTAVHKCIEAYHREMQDGKPSVNAAVFAFSYSESLAVKLVPIMIGYDKWARENVRKVLESEKSFAADGYAGKTDMLFSTVKIGRDVLPDFKTQGTKPGKKVSVYPEMGLQLAAYANGLDLLGKVKLWNVIISTTEPGRIEVVDWTETGQQEYEAFEHLFKVWCHVKKYDPTKEKEDG